MKYRAELHMHSLYSSKRDYFIDSNASIENIAKTCKNRGIDIFSITDHDNIDNHEESAFWAKRLNLLFIPGEEITTKNAGDVIALGIQKCVKGGMSLKSTIAHIHEQGGVAVAAHPFQFPFGSYFAFLWNDFDAVEAYHAYAVGNLATRAVNLISKKPIVAGSDAHYLSEIGAVYTIFQGTIRTQKDVLDAIIGSKIGTGGKRIGMISALIYRLNEWKKKKRK